MIHPTSRRMGTDVVSALAAQQSEEDRAVGAFIRAMAHFTEVASSAKSGEPARAAHVLTKPRLDALLLHTVSSVQGEASRRYVRGRVEGLMRIHREELAELDAREYVAPQAIEFQ